MVRRRLRLGAARPDTAVREAQQGGLGLHGPVQLELPVAAELAAADAADAGGPGREQHVTLATHVHQHRMINLNMCMFFISWLSLSFFSFGFKAF